MQQASTEVATLPQDEAKSMFEFIKLAVTDDRVDPQKLNLLLDAQFRFEDRQHQRDFNAAMMALRSELGPIKRNKKNTQTNSMYVDLEALKKAVDPLLKKHGFRDRYVNDYPSETMVGTTCILTHENGWSEETYVRFSVDDVGLKGTKNKTVTHGQASAMSYGQRLSLAQAIGVQAVKDDDGNAAGGSLPIDTEQTAELDTLIREKSADLPAFLTYFKIESVSDLKRADFEKAKNMLNRKAKTA